MILRLRVSYLLSKSCNSTKAQGEKTQKVCYSQPIHSFEKKEISREVFFGVVVVEGAMFSILRLCHQRQPVPEQPFAADGHTEWFQMLKSQAPAGLRLGIEYWWNIVSIYCNAILSKWLHANWEIPTWWICRISVKTEWFFYMDR